MSRGKYLAREGPGSRLLLQGEDRLLCIMGSGFGQKKGPPVSRKSQAGVLIIQRSVSSYNVAELHQTRRRNISFYHHSNHSSTHLFSRRFTLGLYDRSWSMDAQYGAGAQLQSCWTYKEHFVDGITFPFLHYRNDSITLHLCYFSKYACVKPQNICTTSCQTPRLALGTISARVLTRCLQSVGHRLLLPSCHEQ